MSKLITNTIRGSGASVDALTFDTNGNTLIADNEELQIGSGSDLKLYHNGTDSYIDNVTNNLIIRVASTEKAIACVANGATELYHNGTQVALSSSTGFDIASGKGITFGNSASNGQGGATLLDDYEEGVYTPTWSGGVDNKDSYDEFTYVKVGNLVHLAGAFCCKTTANDSSQHPKFTLPFTAASNSSNGYNVAVGAIRARNVDYATGFICSNIDGGSAYCNFYIGSDNADWAIMRSDYIAVDDEMTICLTYRCA